MLNQKTLERNYEYNTGFSVCGEHHKLADSWLKEGGVEC